MYTKQEALDMLRDKVKQFGSQQRYATHLGMSQQQLNQIIKEKRPLGDKVLNDLKIYREDFYKPID